ncbi:MAG: SWIM zinc finger family protein [Caldilinea sp.]|nr:SWIM zinc finger domain-containing protein [Caldilineaceae bacterium]MCO5213647.1 SWIM zinc finger family protein [Caldilinea sp.]MCW5842955.1 SWIM zinc finger domain-containing protein [Caldilinea sp.]
MIIPSFTEVDIRAGATSQSFSRGKDYYDNGAVLEIARRGALITAEVEGSDYAPYAITIQLDDAGAIDDAMCSCPYDYSGYCKHIVAVLLALLHGDTVEEHADLETLIDGLTEAQLRQIILTVGGEQAGFADAIERAIILLRRTAPDVAGAPDAPLPPIDVAAIRRELRRALRSAAATGGGGGRSYYYDEYDDMAIDAAALLAPGLDVAEALLVRGDPTGALTVLAGLIEEWGESLADLEEWIVEANEDAFAEAASDVDALFAECLLSLPLTEAERATWQERLDDWAGDAMRLAVSEIALETGWEYPPLVAAMQGNITEQGAWEGEPPDGSDLLAQARLRILARQGRDAEYLNLAQAEGELLLYVTRLIELGEIARAVDEAIAYLAMPSEVLATARLLDARGHHAEALQVAAPGLDLTYPYYLEDLARWLAPHALAQGDTALALRAVEIAFRQSHRLDDYQAAERIAGTSWDAVKRGLLDDLRQAGSYTEVDIYLYEHMLVEAMQSVDRHGDYSADLERVIEAVRGNDPDWCIGHCKRRAERIMNGGDAKRYDDAAAWLRRARTLYAEHDRLAEWQPYLAGLLETHQRKYKLVPLLKALRQ